MSQSWGAASLYRTAIVRGHIVTHNGEHDLPAGTVVAVKLRCIARNPMYRRNEPVYSVTLADGSYWGDLYENALTGFVL